MSTAFRRAALSRLRGLRRRALLRHAFLADAHRRGGLAGLAADARSARSWLSRARAVPAVLPARAAGGHVADHADRRLVLIVRVHRRSLLRGACCCGSRCPTCAGVWPAFLAMALFGVGRAFWMPTGQAITPNLVPAEAFPKRGRGQRYAVSDRRDRRARASAACCCCSGPHAVYGTALGLLLIVVIAIASIKPVRAAGARNAAFACAICSRDCVSCFTAARCSARSRWILFAVLFGGATAMLPIYASDVLHVMPAGLRRAARRAGRWRCARRGDARVLADPAPRRALDVRRRRAVRRRDHRVRHVQDRSGSRWSRCSCSAWATW